jgi:hypothetical protein
VRLRYNFDYCPKDSVAVDIDLAGDQFSRDACRMSL